VPVLPDFPWDAVDPYRERAARHSDGLVDLSIGTPVDPAPMVAQRALARASNAPGYPRVAGTAALHDAVMNWLHRRLGITASDAMGIIPTIGSKELVAWLPTLLGLGRGDTVVYPELAYPTYDIGARLAGAESMASDSVTELDRRNVGLIWVNSPANPHGRVWSAQQLARLVDWARQVGAVVASDECYLEFGWEARPVSVLDPAVNGGSLDGVVAVHSLSKRSNLAGYRVGFVAGDATIVAGILEIRRHAGMMVPTPIQAAAVAALNDDEHVDRQIQRYQRRRSLLRDAFESAGFRLDHSEGGFYLWVTRGQSCWETLGWLADRGIVAAPGQFYGPTGAQHVRVALTATDAKVAAAAARLASVGVGMAGGPGQTPPRSVA
jgi:succinyldiaminopimelate transaminase